MPDGVLVLLKVKSIANQFRYCRIGDEGEGSGVGFDGEWMTLSEVFEAFACIDYRVSFLLYCAVIALSAVECLASVADGLWYAVVGILEENATYA